MPLYLFPKPTDPPIRRAKIVRLIPIEEEEAAAHAKIREHTPADKPDNQPHTIRCIPHSPTPHAVAPKPPAAPDFIADAQTPAEGPENANNTPKNVAEAPHETAILLQNERTPQSVSHLPPPIASKGEPSVTPGFVANVQTPTEHPENTNNTQKNTAETPQEAEKPKSISPSHTTLKKDKTQNAERNEEHPRNPPDFTPSDAPLSAFLETPKREPFTHTPFGKRTAVPTSTKERRSEQTPAHPHFEETQPLQIFAQVTREPYFENLHFPSESTNAGTPARKSAANNSEANTNESADTPPQTPAPQKHPAAISATISEAFRDISRTYPPTESTPKQEAETITHISVAQITPNAYQPRKHFSESALQELATSIQTHGILQPLIVRKSSSFTKSTPHYELIAGERRLKAAMLCNFSTVPCIIIQVSEKETAVLALVENLQRKNLHFFEEAAAIRQLIDRFSCTQEEIAQKLGCSQSYIANKLRILRLSAEEQAQIIKNNLSERHARALLAAKSTKTRQEVLENIIRNNWTVAKTEQYLAELQEKEVSPAEKTTVATAHQWIERAISRFQRRDEAILCVKREDETAVEWLIRVPRA